MPDYKAHVLVCSNNAEDKIHCGDKGGGEVRQRFNRLLVEHGLLEKVIVSGAGCTSQHRLCEQNQCTVIVYGPRPEMGGTWYIATADDVEKIITEHLLNERIVEELVNDQRNVNFA